MSCDLSVNRCVPDADAAVDPTDAAFVDAALADAAATDAAQPIPVVEVAAGAFHTCVRLQTGTVRCWGGNSVGQLGYGNTEALGDDETAASAADVDLGGLATQIAAGAFHTCALLDTKAVRCWGQGEFGQLGYGNTNNIGDDEAPSAPGDVNVGGAVMQIAAGDRHTCALLETGVVRCWGEGQSGRLGYGNTNSIGDDESPSFAGDVDVGGTVTQIAAGESHTCARLDTGAVRCWGQGVFGQLGYANTNDIGDDEAPATAGDVVVGASVMQVDVARSHTCARLSGGAVRCWGLGSFGELGYGDGAQIGDDETPSSAGDVDVGAAAARIALGGNHTCAVVAGNVRCWGQGTYGQLGYANTNDIGDNEAPSTAGDVDVGAMVTGIAAGSAHTCALLDTARVRCWGVGGNGRLGHGNTDNVGDDETPASAGDVPLF